MDRRVFAPDAATAGGDGIKFPPDLTAEEIARFFPGKKEELQPGIFEVALVLGGTVSAGAYTGGVLDYLMEALDAWQDAKEADSKPGGEPKVPPHKTVISVVTGASGGAITGSIMARAAGWDFPHGRHEANPFHRAWVDGVTFEDMLSVKTTDGAAAAGVPLPGLASLLDTGGIDRVAKAVIEEEIKDANGERTERSRSYLANPLRIILTVGNLTGVPYSIRFSGVAGLRHEMHAHADSVRFALNVPNGVTNEQHRTLRPDEIPLDSHANTPTNKANWQLLETSCLATSAFPVAFKCRELRRRMDALRYRAVVVPGENGQAEIRVLRPDWSRLANGSDLPQHYNFINVDGGTIDNEPLELARQTLTGYVSHAPQSGDKAHRATVLIDPFSDPEELGPTSPTDVLGTFKSVISAWLHHARYKAGDVVLAEDVEVYSRFIVAPHRDDSGKTVIGSMALATGGLGGFLGFMDKSFVRHDFELGRANARRFLEEVFVLPRNNPLFREWSEEMKSNFARTKQYRKDGAEVAIEVLPIIPLMDALRHAQILEPEKPQTSFTAESLHDKIEAKLNQIYKELRQQYHGVPTGFWGSLFSFNPKAALVDAYLDVGWKALRQLLTRHVIAAIDGEISRRKLRS